VKDEVLRDGDRGDRVELEEPELVDGVEHAPRRPVEELRADGDPAGLLDSDNPRRAGLRHGGSWSEQTFAGENTVSARL
jgi:hypothetical protein